MSTDDSTLALSGDPACNEQQPHEIGTILLLRMDKIQAQVNGRHEEHGVFVAPENLDATIWRYLDFTKFVALLSTESLFFARVDTFDDSFEGSYTVGNLEVRDEFAKRHAPAFGQTRAEMLATDSHVALRQREEVFANCWNMSERESAAFWGLYVPPEGGVAVRSTVHRLIKAIGQSEPAPGLYPVFVGEVIYIDYDEEILPQGNLLYPFVHKRKSFEFESELRAVIAWESDYEDVGDVPPGGRLEMRKRQPPPLGLSLAVDLTELVAAIYVSPTAPPWFGALVRSVVAHYACSAEVVQSSLSAEPIF